MNDLAIRVEHLGKLYHIGPRERYKAFRDTLTDALYAPFRKLSGNSQSAIRNSKSEYIWALKDVSFEVKQGEVVGIIGRNGAGKSTLLKILSRITKPTEGRAEIHGRVGSLLEVGTGFHPELTGRENLYLNGAILGMKKAEIEHKFDEIVAFAEVEKFIDTPVKHYSSGMYVRLAFAVAAHLEPEILVVDEVLAVGDAEFQKKCLGKMGDVAKGGRTVLFVSHNMSAIQRLCTECIVLDQGHVTFNGKVSRAVEHYLGDAKYECQRTWPDLERSPGNEVVRLRAIRFVDVDGHVRPEFDVRDRVTLEIEYQVLEPVQLSISLQFISGMGTYIMASLDNYIQGRWGRQPPYSVGSYRSSCYIPGNLLNEGRLSINVWIYSPPLAPNQSPHVRLLDAVSITIVDSHNPGGARGTFPYEWGLEPAVRPRLRWTTEQVTK